MDELSQINQNNALINNEDVINSALPSENEIISRQNIYDYNQNNNEEQNNFKQTPEENFNKPSIPERNYSFDIKYSIPSPTRIIRQTTNQPIVKLQMSVSLPKFPLGE